MPRTVKTRHYTRQEGQKPNKKKAAAASKSREDRDVTEAGRRRRAEPPPPRPATAPAAFRLALPRSNPAIYVTLSLGVTFPFNVVVGIPLYIALANWLF